MTELNIRESYKRRPLYFENILVELYIHTYIHTIFYIEQKTSACGHYNYLYQLSVKLFSHNAKST